MIKSSKEPLLIPLIGLKNKNTNNAGTLLISRLNIAAVTHELNTTMANALKSGKVWQQH